MKDLNNLKFERNIWADQELSKLCPGNDINKLNAMFSDKDFVKQTDISIQAIIILNKAWEEHEHYKDPSHKVDPVRKEDLIFLSEEELGELFDRAMNDCKKDSETTIQTEPIKKSDAELTESI